METPSLSSIQISVERTKDKIFTSNFDPYSFVCPSAYDTAWLAMIPADSHNPSQPMFQNCLDWLLNNQQEEGFWGECDAFGKPTLESLPATLASMVALKKWNIGEIAIDRGLEFLEANTEKLFKDIDNDFPRWFTIVFPAMVELSKSVGLEIVFPDAVTETVSSILRDQLGLLDKEELVGKHCFLPLLSYLEALPPSYAVSEEDIYSNLSSDGSLFQSPSATAKAFMATGKIECLSYLKSIIQRCPNGVPQTYPMDEDHIKLCMVNQLQRQGLGEHFVEDIKEILTKVYRKYQEQQSWVIPTNMVAAQLHKDSLAFQLLRMHGYSVLPTSVSVDPNRDAITPVVKVHKHPISASHVLLPNGRYMAYHEQGVSANTARFSLVAPHCFLSSTLTMSFRWFLDDEIVRAQIEKEPEHFSTTMLYMYRASNLNFCGEYELEKAKYFSRYLLEKSLLTKNGEPRVKLSRFQQMVERELNIPWLSRLDHLDHRMWMEENEANILCIGKTSHARISHLHNSDLLELAMQNYQFRQSIFKNELKELIRWSQSCGLMNMGFGRQKTTYCYYAIAAATTFPHDSYVRTFVAKSAIMITVADDFFDAEGSLHELEDLASAVRRWDSRGLSSHGKVIFDALDNLVSEAAEKYLHQGGTHDIKNCLQDLWYETLASWLTETKWNKKGQAPSIDEYMKNGMISIAAHTMILPASCFLQPCLPYEKLKPDQYETITQLIMLICRILNDIQSYEREIEEGKWNFLQLHLMMNPNFGMEDSIAFGREIIGKKKKEFLQQFLVDGQSDLPKPCKLLHLTCLKVFEMFYNSSNAFDSNTQLLEDINKAIYLPLSRNVKPPRIVSMHNSRSIMKHTSMQKVQFGWSFKHYKSRVSFCVHQVSPPALTNCYGIVPINLKTLLPAFI